MKNLFNWEAEYDTLNYSQGEIKGWKAVVRSDNGKVLDIPKKGYHILTNQKMSEMAYEIQDKTNGDYQIHEAQEWDNGGKVMIHLKKNSDIQIANWDAHAYMVIGNGHNRSQSFFVGHSNQFHRCKNQFASTTKEFRLRHTSNIESKLKNIVEIIRLYKQKADHVKEILEKGYQVPVQRELIQGFIKQSLSIDPSLEFNKISKVKVNQSKSLYESINSEMSEVGENLFGLFNGLTHYTTHKIKSQGPGQHILGSAYRINKRGFDYISNALPENTMITV